MSIQIITSPVRRAFAVFAISIINIASAGYAAPAHANDEHENSIRLRSLFGTQLNPVQASDSLPLDRFGTSVAVGNRYAIVGAPGNDQNAGAAYVFAPDWNGHWKEQAKLVPPDGTFNSQVGVSVAIAGDTALVGTGVTDAQAAHVFARQGSTWVREARLEVPQGQLAVALSADGARAVIGVSGAAQSPTEAVYVFARQKGGQWLREAILSPEAGHGSSTAFGSSVAISGDTVVVGASGEDDLTGAAYVFARGPQGDWQLQARLQGPADPALTGGGAFGWDVAVSDATLVVGAFGYDFFRGAAYVFHRLNGQWTQQARLDPQDTGTQFQCFGVSVALAFDQAIIGQPCDGQRGGVDTHVYVFTRGFNNSTWTQRAALVSPAGGDTSNFGLSLATNGVSLLLGSPSESAAGLAYALNCLPCLLLGKSQAAEVD